MLCRHSHNETFEHFIKNIALLRKADFYSVVKFVILAYKYWLLMRGMVENYCPWGEIQPWPTIHLSP